jgi:hypothetical protein
MSGDDAQLRAIAQNSSIRTETHVQKLISPQPNFFAHESVM